MYCCPFCKNINSEVAFKNYYGYDLVYCINCEMEFMHPYKAPGAEYYENSEDELSAIRHAKLEDWPNTHPSTRFHLFKNKDLEVLDIGCSNGAFAEFVSDTGSKITGMDFDANSLNLAKTRNLNQAEFIQGDLSDLKKIYPNKKFDVISMFMVLEHIESPMETVNEIYDLLKPNGYFIGTIPNEERYWAKSYNLKSALPPLHLNYWNKKAFKNHIEKHTKFSLTHISNTAHYGYVSYVWKMKQLPKFNNPFIILCIRVLFTVAQKLEIAIEKITEKGSGTYFEMKK